MAMQFDLLDSGKTISIVGWERLTGKVSTQRRVMWAFAILCGFGFMAFHLYMIEQGRDRQMSEYQIIHSQDELTMPAVTICMSTTNLGTQVNMLLNPKQMLQQHARMADKHSFCKVISHEQDDPYTTNNACRRENSEENIRNGKTSDKLYVGMRLTIVHDIVKRKMLCVTYNYDGKVKARDGRTFLLIALRWYKKSDMRADALYDNFANYQVIIHSHEHRPFRMVDTFDMIARPNSHNTITMAKTTYKRTQNCSEGFNGDEVYNNAENCFNNEFFSSNEMRRFLALREYGAEKLNKGLLKQSDKEYEDMMRNLTILYDRGHRKCYEICYHRYYKKRCKEEVFDTKSTPYETRKVDIKKPMLISRNFQDEMLMASFNIHYKTIKSTQIEQKAALDLLSFLALLAGALGFCLGIRVLTLLQICECLYDYIRNSMSVHTLPANAGSISIPDRRHPENDDGLQTQTTQAPAIIRNV